MYIRAVARRAFDAPPAIAAQPEHLPQLQTYLSDLVRPYGLPLLDGLAGHSYGEMGAALVAELVPSDRPVDLLVLAFAIPDVRPGRATALYLSHLCPGRPLAFAVCDQGSAAAFTGLRLVRAYLRSGEYQRGLLLVVEQAGLPYDTGLPADVPTAHTAVGLLCDSGGGPARVGSIRQFPGVAPERVADLVAGAQAGGGTLIATGGELLATDGELLASRRPLTGVWWDLAEALRSPGRVLLATHDPYLRYLSLSTIDVES